MSKGVLLMPAFLISLFFLAILHAAPAYSEDVIGSGCSVSNVGYLTDVAREYESRTGVKVLIRGGGTVVGIEDVKEGRVDFAASCRKKTPGDPKDLEFIQVAWDALVFITHKSNKVSDMTLDKIKGVFAGKIANWNQLGGGNMPIKLFISKPGKGLSGVESSAREMVLNGTDSSQAAGAISLPSSGIVEQLIEQTEGGFAVSGYSSARKRNVKILKLNGVYPNKENIAKNKYPLRRPLFLILPAKPKPSAKGFVEFVLSKDGQSYISKLGVVSLTDVK